MPPLLLVGCLMTRQTLQDDSISLTNRANECVRQPEGMAA